MPSYIDFVHNNSNGTAMPSVTYSAQIVYITTIYLYNNALCQWINRAAAATQLVYPSILTIHSTLELTTLNYRFIFPITMFIIEKNSLEKDFGRDIYLSRRHAWISPRTDASFNIDVPRPFDFSLRQHNLDYTGSVSITDQENHEASEARKQQISHPARLKRHPTLGGTICLHDC